MTSGVYIGFRVDVTELGRGWRVTVDAGQEGDCVVTMPTLAQALRVASAVMGALAVPDVPGAGYEVDRLEAVARLSSAPDGPPDMGGGS